MKPPKDSGEASVDAVRKAIEEGAVREMPPWIGELTVYVSVRMPEGITVMLSMTGRIRPIIARTAPTFEDAWIAIGEWMRTNKVMML